jgi:hypothetical protein
MLLLSFISCALFAVFVIAMFFVGMVPLLYYQVDWRFVFMLGGAGWLILSGVLFKLGIK